MAWAIHKRAALEISAPDFEAVYEMKESGALVQNPWVAILNKQAMILASLGDRLGLDPKSRASLTDDGSLVSGEGDASKAAKQICIVASGRGATIR